MQFFFYILVSVRHWLIDMAVLWLFASLSNSIFKECPITEGFSNFVPDGMHNKIDFCVMLNMRTRLYSYCKWWPFQRKVGWTGMFTCPHCLYCIREVVIAYETLEKVVFNVFHVRLKEGWSISEWNLEMLNVFHERMRTTFPYI